MTLAARISLLLLPLAASAAPAGPAPLAYTGEARAESTADGFLPLAVGAHNIEVFRANRTHSAHADGLAHTYLHQPMLAWWRGRFYLEYLSAARNEHDSPTVTSLMTSTDGLHWEAPRTLFPSFALPDGSQTIAHQRMGFYVAPDGRLLALSFYGKPPEPNEGDGIGRAVRELREDGSFGPIYFIRLNAHCGYPGFKPPYPLYSESPDKGFVAACEALLANKLMTAQWWEEEQLDDSGFFRIKGKALSYITRPDGSVLGIWKNALVATTTDRGHTWTEKQFATNLPNNASKYALTRTGDGRYALFLNPTNRLRFPLAVMTSDDASHFDRLLTVHGETPDLRFAGGFKNLGPQYVRVIAEGNGTPPDAAKAVWVAYSVNKEDLWVSRVPVPLAGSVVGPVRDDFENAAPGSLPEGWNIYSPLWAPVRVAATADAAGKPTRALELRDADPCDYARAIRVFPATHGLKASFKVRARQTNARLEIELSDARNRRTFLFAFGEDGRLWACHEGVWTDNGPYVADKWVSFDYESSPKPGSDRGDLRLDGKPATPKSLGPTESAPTVERLSFRTGAQRLRPYGGPDVPGADTRVPEAVFQVDDVSLTPLSAP